MRKIIAFIMALILVSASAAFAESAADIIKSIQGVYDKAVDYSADFYQRSEVVSTKRAMKAAGTVHFKKNGRMYWEYTKPMKQKIIANADTMWIYEPDMNQVQQFDKKALGMSKTASSFLNGIGKLMDDFDVTYSGKDDNGYLILDMVPKDEAAGFTDMKMYVDRATHNIVKTVTTDAYGNTNSIAFQNITFDTGVKDEFFDFKVPEGVHIVTPPASQ